MTMKRETLISHMREAAVVVGRIEKTNERYIRSDLAANLSYINAAMIVGYDTLRRATEPSDFDTALKLWDTIDDHAPRLREDSDSNEEKLASLIQTLKPQFDSYFHYWNNSYSAAGVVKDKEVIGSLRMPVGHDLALGYCTEVFKLGSGRVLKAQFHEEHPMELRIEPVENGSLFHFRELYVPDGFVPAELTLISTDTTAKSCVIHFDAAGEFFYKLMHQIEAYENRADDQDVDIKTMNSIDIPLEVVDFGLDRRVFLTDGGESFHPVYYNGESVGQMEDWEVPKYVTAANANSKPAEELEIKKPATGITPPPGLSKPGERHRPGKSMSM